MDEHNESKHVKWEVAWKKCVYDLIGNRIASFTTVEHATRAVLCVNACNEAGLSDEEVAAIVELTKHQYLPLKTDLADAMDIISQITVMGILPLNHAIYMRVAKFQTRHKGG